MRSLDINRAITTLALSSAVLGLFISCGAEEKPPQTPEMEVAQEAGGQFTVESIDPHGLLIEPEDFPGRDLKVVTRDIGNLFTGIPSPHVELKGPDIVVHYHYAFVNDSETALALIASVLSDYTRMDGFEILDSRDVFPNSAMNVMGHSTGQQVHIFFAEGAVVGRVVIWGPVQIDEILPFAEKARERILRKSGELP